MRDVDPKNVETWLDLLRSFDQARGHFAESYRHALLGFAETVRVFQEMAANDPRATSYGGMGVVSLLDVIRRGLAMWADKIPGLLEASNLDVAKREALITVKEVLRAEMARIREREELLPEELIKIDALEAILRVVDMELARREETAAEPAPSIRRVVIE
jgi:hypothetical protein